MLETFRLMTMIYATFLCVNFTNFFALIFSQSASQIIYGYWFTSLSKGEALKLFLENPFYTFLFGVIFYMLQKRELKNFFAERRTQLKHEQVKTIFDSQSDAIVAVENNDAEILFNNKNSVSLFDHDFQSQDFEEQSKLDKKRFRLMTMDMV